MRDWEEQLSDLKRLRGGAGAWVWTWKGALRVISQRCCCIYRSSQKKRKEKKTLPSCCTPPEPLPHFQLARDGSANVIRSNYSAPGASSLSQPQTQHRHTLLTQEGKSQTQLLYSSIHSPVHPSLPLHWSSFTMSSTLRPCCSSASSCVPPFSTHSCSPVFQRHKIPNCLPPLHPSLHFPLHISVQNEHFENLQNEFYRASLGLSFLFSPHPRETLVANWKVVTILWCYDAVYGKLLQGHLMFGFSIKSSEHCVINMYLFGWVALWVEHTFKLSPCKLRPKLF